MPPTAQSVQGSATTGSPGKATMDRYEALAVLGFLAKALVEVMFSFLTFPFRKLSEVPQVHSQDTSQNRRLRDSCPSLQRFTNCPWASYPHAQTFFSLLKFGKRPQPRRENVPLSDGVQVVLDWYELPGFPDDAPVVVSLHGIGGDENAVRPIMLAEECLQKGWRSVLYVRRGHGISSLLPAVDPALADEAVACSVGCAEPASTSAWTGSHTGLNVPLSCPRVAASLAADNALAPHPSMRLGLMPVDIEPLDEAPQDDVSAVGSPRSCYSDPGPAFEAAARHAAVALEDAAAGLACNSLRVGSATEGRRVTFQLPGLMAGGSGSLQRQAAAAAAAVAGMHAGLAGAEILADDLEDGDQHAPESDVESHGAMPGVSGPALDDDNLDFLSCGCMPGAGFGGLPYAASPYLFRAPSLSFLTVPNMRLPHLPNFRNLPNLRHNLPNLPNLRNNLPNINLPSIRNSLPSINLANLRNLPNFRHNLPSLPNMSLPNFPNIRNNLASINLQNLPNISFPHLPNISLPSLPSFPSLPSITLGGHMPRFASIGHGLASLGWATPTAASAAGASAADPEMLRRTRKAFPMHADTDDFKEVLEHIRASYPNAPMLAVGFSMGSNVLVKYMGDQQSAHGGPLLAGVSVCNGYDIVEGTQHLVSRRPLADSIMTAALRKLLRRRLPEVHSICAAHGLLIDFDELLTCRTIRRFEEGLMLPIYGFTSLDEYYKHNNCKESLKHVSEPLLCLSSLDDPIVAPGLVRHAKDAAACNPNVLLAITKRGGHLGWMQGWRGKPWMMDVIVQYVQSVINIHEEQRKLQTGAQPVAIAAEVPAVSAPPVEEPSKVSAAMDGEQPGAAQGLEGNNALPGRAEPVVPAEVNPAEAKPTSRTPSALPQLHAATTPLPAYGSAAAATACEAEVCIVVSESVPA